MSNRITKALEKLFEKHRIVFWYDADRDLRKEFDDVDLEGVSKVEILNNEIALKYRLLREEPQRQFLVYKHGDQPLPLENWLLDVQLAQAEFRTDQAAIWLAELELGYEFSDIVREHQVFFNNKKRREQLKKLVTGDDTQSRIRLKMMAVCAGSDPRLDSILENLLSDHALKKSERINDIKRSDLESFLWEQVGKVYAYNSNAPGVHDFAIELFKSCYAMSTEGDIKLNSEALVFLKRWKDSRQHEEAFEILSNQCAQLLRIEDDLQQRDYKQVIELDYFELIDRRIVCELVDAVRNRTISSGECTQQVRVRRTSHWHEKFSDLYDAIEYASQFYNALDHSNTECESLSQGLQAYTSNLFRVDQLYRKFLLAFRRSRQVTLLEQLVEDVRNRYTNSFLRPLSDSWQQRVNEQSTWGIPNATKQSDFFKRCVDRFLSKNNKVFVIVSDALRYEIADELASIISQEDRFEAELSCMIAGLPSYTQLGMASLLPHKSLEIRPDFTAIVSVDGQSSQGTENRNALLRASHKSIAACALQAEDVLNRNGDSCRELIRDFDIIYIYQNRIDSTGHKRDTEKDVFIAVESAMEEIGRLVKKLASANANNILITADHGFLYQDEVVEESDFSIADPQGELLVTDRRFIIGKNLHCDDGVKIFAAKDLGQSGDLQIMVPNSINRFRKRGSSTRFLHGGATLQEIVVPIIEVNRKRSTTVTLVDVDLIPSSSSTISSGQLAIVLFQSQPVAEKLQARKLKIGIYAKTGELLSDEHEINFDLTSDNPREREQRVRLLLSKRADDFNKQQVHLRFRELVGSTTHYTDYKEFTYTLRRSFTSGLDFDLE